MPIPSTLVVKLAVISPESHDSREIAVVQALFAAGLEHYRVRKPRWSAEELVTYFRHFSAAGRARMIIHSHPDLAQIWGLSGIHERDEGTPLRVETTSPSPARRSRACHDLPCLREALGHFDAVLLGPMFASISKSGHGPDGRIPLEELTTLLHNRTPAQRRTAIFALGGINAANTSRCRELGFDGVAVLGAVWNAQDPVGAFREIHRACVASENSKFGRATAAASSSRHSSLPREPIMCLTQDGLPLSHVEQARRLSEGGARWIQLRMKDAAPDLWLKTARSVGQICRTYGAVFIVNDSVEVALESNADGVHLGKTDLEWSAARRLLGSDRILGGTVNNSVDAERARLSGCLDYVGLGPWRFTSNKKNLSPVLGPEGVRRLVEELEGLPAWAIGGIEAADIPAVQAAGATGVAISSALHRNGKVEENFHLFRGCWRAERANIPVTTL